MMEWVDYDDAESDPEKMGGTIVLKGTRVPVSTITDHVDSFIEEGLSEEYSMMLTFALFPTVELDRIYALIAYRDSHDLELQA